MPFRLDPRAMVSPFGGLTLLPRNAQRAVWTTIAAVLGVTVFIVLLDGGLFRTQLADDYLAFYSSPLLPRMFVVSAFAMVEEIKYRLLLMSGIVAFALLVRIKPTAALFWAAILIAQFVNVGTLVVADPLYASLRFWLVGSVWGWLYWRHGFAAAFVGHGTSHLLIDPVLLLVLR